MEGTKLNLRKPRRSDGGVDTGPVLFKAEFDQPRFSVSGHERFETKRLEKSTSYHVILPVSTLKRLREQYFESETNTTDVPPGSDSERCGTGQSRTASVSSEFEVDANKDIHKDSPKSSHVSTPESYDTDSSGKESGYLTLEDLEEQFRVKLPWHVTNKTFKSCERQTQVSFHDFIEAQQCTPLTTNGGFDGAQHRSEDEVIESGSDDDDDEASDNDDVFLENSDDNANIQLQAPFPGNVDICQEEPTKKVESEWKESEVSSSYAIMIKPDQWQALNANRLSKLDNCQRRSILKRREDCNLNEVNGNDGQSLDNNRPMEEQIYMSWEEVMTEAQHLGIKLILPRTKKKDRVWFALNDTKSDGPQIDHSYRQCKRILSNNHQPKKSTKQTNEFVDNICGEKKFLWISKLKQSLKEEVSFIEKSLSAIKKHGCCCECCCSKQQTNTRCPIKASCCQQHIRSYRICQPHHSNRCCQKGRTPSPKPVQQTVKPHHGQSCAESLKPSLKYDLMTSLKQLQHKNWYWGSCSVEKIEEHLRGKEDGSFVLRDSSDDRYVLTVSYTTSGRIRHTRIEHHTDKFCVRNFQSSQLMSVPEFLSKVDEIFEDSSKNFGRVCYLVKFKGAARESFEAFRNKTMRTSAGHQTLVHLFKPVSKLRCLLALKSLCKLAILRRVEANKLQELHVSLEVWHFLRGRGF